MTSKKVTWDTAGNKFYESGVKKGVIYYLSQEGEYTNAEGWDGLTAITENPSGAEETPLYANDAKYLSLRSAEEFGYTIEAYTYPPGWGACDGSASIATGVTAGQQKRKTFGLSYVSGIGNDTEGDYHAYKIHLVYGSTASPSSRARKTINDSPEAVTLSWEVSTTPVSTTVEGLKPTSTLTIDTRTADKDKVAALETILYGNDTTVGRLPLPDEVVTLFGALEGGGQ